MSGFVGFPHPANWTVPNAQGNGLWSPRSCSLLLPTLRSWETGFRKAYQAKRKRGILKACWVWLSFCCSFQKFNHLFTWRAASLAGTAVVFARGQVHYQVDSALDMRNFPLKCTKDTSSTQKVAPTSYMSSTCMLQCDLLKTKILEIALGLFNCICRLLMQKRF